MQSTVLLYTLAFFGSSLGGLARYWISGLVAARFGEQFPAGTLFVNVTGAFVIGLVWSLPWQSSLFTGVLWARDFLMLGLMGGYTTVSSFSWNTLNLIRDGEWLYAGLNLFGSWALCLGAVYAGSFTASALFA